jgi:mannose-6-phosphate isomerase
LSGVAFGPMELSQPLIFEPLFMERVWGGRRLERLFGKHLPVNARIGEAWEIVDREEAQSVVHEGVLRGKTMHELWTDRREQVFGAAVPDSPRFPLLIKLLDAQERLSVQVHPPAHMAAALDGEPKTEMWYFAETQEDADIFAGLRSGVTREDFERALHDGTVANMIHRLPVRRGQAIFIPSGRIHAIGAGNVIVEVQQNSDTTYRVFDWNRVGLDGRPREMHIEESMQSIDFDDVEPGLAPRQGELVTECEYFRVEEWQLSGEREGAPQGSFAIFACLDGEVECAGVRIQPGGFFLLPASVKDRTIRAPGGSAKLLRTTIPGT